VGTRACLLWGKGGGPSDSPQASPCFCGLKFLHQCGIGPSIVDFYCANRWLVIKVDGESHAEAAQIVADRERDTYLQSLGVCVVRDTNADVVPIWTG